MPPRRLQPELQCEWREQWLDVAKASVAADATVALAAGHSIILLPQLATQEECKSLLQTVTQALRVTKRKRKIGVSSSLSESIRLTVAKDLGIAARSLTESIIKRVLQLIENHLPALRESLLYGCTCPLGEMSLIDFEFSDEEPAVIVYGVGGEFRPHRDKQSITVLIPLTSNDDYTGGGTAFWSEGMVDHDSSLTNSSTPTLVLRPPAGTVLLFGGEVMHAARPVTCGTRVVFVASFTPCGQLSKQAALTPNQTEQQVKHALKVLLG